MSLTRQKRHQRWPSHQNRFKTAFLKAKLAGRPISLGASSSSIDSERSASRRPSKVKANKDGEVAAINYLHNAQGQRVFKGEPKVLNYQPMDLKVPKVVTTGYLIRILARVAQVTRFEGIIATQPMVTLFSL